MRNLNKDEQNGDSTYEQLNQKVASQLEVHRKMFQWLSEHKSFLNTLEASKCEIQDDAFMYIDVKYSDVVPLIKYFDSADWIPTHSRILNTYALTHVTDVGIIVILYFVLCEGHIETHVDEHGQITHSHLLIV